MTALGRKIENFTQPICTHFKPKMLNGQMCYQLDLQDVQKERKFAKGERNGLSFLLDYNEDKMIKDPSAKIEDSISNDGATIYVDTLGILKHDYLTF